MSHKIRLPFVFVSFTIASLLLLQIYFYGFHETLGGLSLTIEHGDGGGKNLFQSFLKTNYDERVPDTNGEFHRYAVSSEHQICSQIGSDIMGRGGNAVDSAIATTFCIGVVNCFSSGIGGGGFMLIRLKNGTAVYVNMRETAPMKAHQNMFNHLPLNASRYGGLSVAVPGEVAGLYYAWQRWGSMEWDQLVRPSSLLAINGFPVGKNLALRLERYKHMIKRNPSFRDVFMPNGKLLSQGDIVYRKTLVLIAQDAMSFYNGKIAKKLVNFVNANGGILDMNDFASYRVKSSSAISSTFRDSKVFSIPPPASGNVLVTIMNILESMGNEEKEMMINYQRIVESFKFAYGIRLNLGDTETISDWVNRTMSKEYARKIAAKIQNNATFQPEYYMPTNYSQLLDHGTTHLSVIDGNDMAVSLTSTINLVFGSQLMEPTTGIILNDQMDDFSVPNRSNYFNYPPCPNNYISPGKRPQSSATPVILERNGLPVIVVGASGGSYIISSTALTLINSLVYGDGAVAAVRRPRLHHQLLPNRLFFEKDFSPKLIASLKSIGHNVSIESPQSAVQMLLITRQSNNRLIQAAADARKDGFAHGA